MGRWHCGLSLLITSSDPGDNGAHAEPHAICFEGLDSAAFLVAGGSQAGNGEARAKPEEVGTGSRLSGTTGGIMWDGPVAMASMVGGVNGLWVE